MSKIGAMKRALVTTGIAALMLLTGCTSTTTNETVTVTPGASGTYSDGDTTVEVQPLTAEAPELTDADTTYLEAVRANLRPDNVIPNATDEQLLAAGHEACDRRAAGEASDTISLIDGEEAVHGYYRDSLQIIQAAAENLC